MPGKSRRVEEEILEKTPSKRDLGEIRCPVEKNLPGLGSQSAEVLSQGHQDVH